MYYSNKLQQTPSTIYIVISSNAFIALHLTKPNFLHGEPPLLQITHNAPLHPFIKNIKNHKNHQEPRIMAELSHTSTAQKGVTPLLLLQTPAWEKVPSNPQLSATNETPLPQWIRPINKGLQRIHKHLINTPLVIKSDDIRKAYKASIICYIAITAPLTVGLEINDTQATAF